MAAAFRVLIYLNNVPCLITGWNERIANTSVIYLTYTPYTYIVYFKLNRAHTLAVIAADVKSRNCIEVCEDARLKAQIATRFTYTAGIGSYIPAAAADAIFIFLFWT